MPLHRDKYAAFVRENQGKHRCSECDKPIEILRRPFWLGIPKHHHKCWARSLAARRNQSGGRAADGGRCGPAAEGRGNHDQSVAKVGQVAQAGKTGGENEPVGAGTD